MSLGKLTGEIKVQAMTGRLHLAQDSLVMYRLLLICLKSQPHVKVDSSSTGCLCSLPNMATLNKSFSVFTINCLFNWLIEDVKQSPPGQVCHGPGSVLNRPSNTISAYLAVRIIIDCVAQHSRSKGVCKWANFCKLALRWG